MKVLFTADLHIRVGQKNIPRKWALNRYDIMFKEFDRVYKEYNCDIIVFGGDIFDKVPTMEELSIFIGYLWDNPQRHTIIFDGNHEATKKGDTFLKYMANMVPPECYVYLDWQEIMHGVEVLPYKDLKTFNGKGDAKILLTHVRGEIPPHVKPEIDLSLFNGYDVVFAGDLHSHSNTQRNIVYPGSPVTVTFHRNRVKTGVIVFESITGDWEWVEINTPQLIRKTVEDPDEMVPTEWDHTIYELVGDILDFSDIPDSELLDKKIVKREVESKLDLKNKTIVEEVAIYCEDILNLPPDKIEQIIEIYNDNAQNFEV